MRCRNISWLPNLRSMPAQALVVALVTVSLSMAGCDKVESMVDDVKNQVAEVTEPEAPVVAEPGAAAPTEIAPAQPVVPKGPTAEEIVAQFEQLRPHEVSDGILAQLASSPEAAAAITDIDMMGGQVSSTGIGYLRALPNLQSIAVNGPNTTAEALAALGKVTTLKVVNLQNSVANDRVVSELAQIPHLQTLNLAGTKVTSAAVASMDSMRELTDLNLFGTSVDDQLGAMLAGLPLRSLNLAKTPISNAIMPSILKIETLESLNVDFCRITGDAYRGINKSNIRSLSVAETPFGIDGFKSIRGMSSLEELNVYGTGLVEHKDVNVFRTFPKLRILNAGRNAVTDAGMDVFFKGLKSLEELNLNKNRGITNQGLAALIGVKTLKLLDVGGSGCGAQGAQALKQKLPECKIITDAGIF